MKSPFRNASDSKRNEGPRDGEAETKLRSLGVSICRESALSAQPRAHRVGWRKGQRDSTGGARALELELNSLAANEPTTCPQLIMWLYTI